MKGISELEIANLNTTSDETWTDKYLETKKLKEELRLREDDLQQSEELNKRNQKSILEELESTIENRQNIECLLQLQKKELQPLEIEFSEMQFYFLEKEEDYEAREREIEEIQKESEATRKMICEVKGKVEEVKEAQMKYQMLCQQAEKDFEYHKDLLKNKIMAEKKEKVLEVRIMNEQLKMEENTLEQFIGQNEVVEETIDQLRETTKRLVHEISEIEVEIEGQRLLEKRENSTVIQINEKKDEIERTINEY